MNRQQKELIVQSLRESFLNNPAAFLVGYKGLTVSQMQALRKKLRKHGGMFKIAKARLMKRAINQLEGNKELIPFFKDQIGLVFASDELPVVAKILHEFAKENEALKLVAGQLDSQLLSKESIVRIGQLPSKEVLLAQVCGAINAPALGLVHVLHILLLRLLLVLKQIEQKKQ